MAVLTAETGRQETRKSFRTAGFRVEFAHDAKPAAARWHDRGSPTPFQDARWLDAWYGAFAGHDHVEPLIAIISDAATSQQVTLVRPVRRMHGGIRIVEFADLALTDYNAPMLGSAAPRDAKAAHLLWRNLLTALRRLPGGADLVRFRKMPVDLDGRPNPLALLDGVRPCALNGNLVTTGNDF